MDVDHDTQQLVRNLFIPNMREGLTHPLRKIIINLMSIWCVLLVFKLSLGDLMIFQDHENNPGNPDPEPEDGAEPRDGENEPDLSMFLVCIFLF